MWRKVKSAVPANKDGTVTLLHFTRNETHVKYAATEELSLKPRLFLQLFTDPLLVPLLSSQWKQTFPAGTRQ